MASGFAAPIGGKKFRWVAHTLDSSFTAIRRCVLTESGHMIIEDGREFLFVTDPGGTIVSVFDSRNVAVPIRGIDDYSSMISAITALRGGLIAFWDGVYVVTFNMSDLTVEDPHYDHYAGNRTGVLDDGVDKSLALLDNLVTMTSDRYDNLFLAMGDCRVRLINVTTGLITTVFGALGCGDAVSGGNAFQSFAPLTTQIAVLSDRNIVALIDNTTSLWHVDVAADAVERVFAKPETMEDLIPSNLAATASFLLPI